MRTSSEGVKRETLNRLGWRKSIYNSVGPRWLGAAASLSSRSSRSIVTKSLKTDCSRKKFSSVKQ